MEQSVSCWERVSRRPPERETLGHFEIGDAAANDALFLMENAAGNRPYYALFGPWSVDDGVVGENDVADPLVGEMYCCPAYYPAISSSTAPTPRKVQTKLKLAQLHHKYEKKKP